MMRKFAGIAILPALILLSGCSMQEVDDRHPVAAFALEKGSSVRLSMQMVKVSGEDSIPKTQTETVEAPSIRQAVSLSGGETYWTTAETVLMDRGSADNGIYDTIRALTQERDIRPMVRICVLARGTGADFIEQQKEADGFQTLLDDAVRGGRAVRMPLYRAQNVQETDGIDLVFPMLDRQGESVRVSGTALFDGEHLAGTLGETQTGLLTVLKGDAKQTVLYDADDTRYELTNVCTKTEVHGDRAGRLYAVLTVTADMKRPAQGDAARAARFLQQNCAQLVENMQEYRCDALGLGRAWYRSSPKAFAARDWKTQYADLDVRVRVRIRPTQGGDAP